MSRWAGRKTGSRKPPPPHEPANERCLQKFQDSHGIWRVCHRKRGHRASLKHRA